jgi:hypothetical protein
MMLSGIEQHAKKKSPTFLPWSTCPAVAMIMAQSPASQSEPFGSQTYRSGHHYCADDGVV